MIYGNRGLASVLMLALASMGANQRGRPRGEDIDVPTDPLAGADAARKQEANDAKFPSRKARLKAKAARLAAERRVRA